MRGWIFDVYPDYKKNVMALWIKTKSGARKIEDGSFCPVFYIYHPSYEELRTLARDLRILDSVSETRMTKKKIDIRSTKPKTVLEVRPRRYSDLKKCAHIVDSRGGYYEYKLFNVDIRLSQRYLAEKGLFPMAMVNVSKGKFKVEDGQFRLRYSIPNLKGMRLSIHTNKRIPTYHDPLTKIGMNDEVLDGREEDILLGLVETLRREDPDVLFSTNGDGFVLPYLYARAKVNDVEDKFVLGRDTFDGRPKKKGKSYFSYGSILYKPPAHTLKGRLHIDSKSSFMYGEGGLSGLIDLSRLSCIPVQDLSRLSPGSAISAMQVNCALSDGYVVLWKKNVPEDFKTAEELIVADRGGMIYEPVVGVHEGIVEVDFTSLYPNIMANYNLSPETMMCDCCPESKRMVPELLYHVCEKRVGLIPRVVKPLVQRRIAFKKLVKAQPERKEMYKQKADILKWLLVTCLDGETIVPYEEEGQMKFQKISEIVDKYLPDGEGILEVNNEFHAFGLKKDMRTTRVPVKRVFKFRSPEKILCLRIRQGRDLWVTKDHPCYVLENGELMVKRADELEGGEALPVIVDIEHEEGEEHWNLSESRIVSIEEVPPRTPYVYCFEVDKGLPGFIVEGNVFTHNCFGYTGYKNARFGRIECHESINAYGRDILVRTMEIAEQYGYEVLHGIVDCLWLKPNGYKDHESFCDHVSREIDIPLDLEGIYKWLVFLPNKTTGIGALNRYYGLFSDDTLKIRGIDLRKRDTPKLMKDAQADMLEALSKAGNKEEFLERLPECIGILKRYHDRIRDGECALEDLVITKRISRDLDDYSQFNDQVAALMQLRKLGFRVNAGEKIRFVICDSSTKEPEKRVKVAELLEGDEKYDAGKYIELLLRSGAGMLVPFGYDEEELRGLMRD
jgi:DNA polymerase elongation subunit (family B)